MRDPLPPVRDTIPAGREPPDTHDEASCAALADGAGAGAFPEAVPRSPREETWMGPTSP
jgi:hypothetical protein